MRYSQVMNCGKEPKAIITNQITHPVYNAQAGPPLSEMCP